VEDEKIRATTKLTIYYSTQFSSHLLRSAQLDFVPASMVEKMKEEGVVELLADIYSQWGDGGGAANIDVNQVVGKVKNLTQKGEGSIFKIPPYFLYIAKSFSVLEGIGLSNDKGYSIINECLPYVSKRLLSDKDERVAGALNSFIFGSEKVRRMAT